MNNYRLQSNEIMTEESRRGYVLRLLILILLGAILFSFWYYFGHRKIDISNNLQANSTVITNPSKYGMAPLSGLKCEFADTRPLAVMLSSDPETRPLSAVGQADMVFEMPVVDVGVTRMMAVYQCQRPEKIGSIRSSRLDFIPLVQGLDAIYSHWGGEKEALAKLDAGVVSNVDGLIYDGIVYYRDATRPRPHNGFTSFESLWEKADELGYNLKRTNISYPHDSLTTSQGVIQPPPVFAGNYEVIWRYDNGNDVYSRFRNDEAENDRNSGKQVKASNVIIMKTSWSPINKDYIRVSTVGTGDATVYKHGIAISGSWVKGLDSSKLVFLDEDGQEIPLAVGTTWVEIELN